MFYGSGDGLVLVDAAAGTVTDLGLSAEEYSPAVPAATGGVGRRFAALVDAAGAAPVLVDLGTGEVADLSDATGDAVVFAAVLDADESAVLVSGEGAIFLVPTDDPGAGEQVGDGFGQFIGDGSSILVTGAAGTVVRTVVTGDEVGLSDDVESGGLVLGNRVVLAREGEIQLVDPTSGDVLATVPFNAENDAPEAPVVVGDSILVGGGTDAWTLLDGGTATVTPLDELTSLLPASTPTTARWRPSTPSPPTSRSPAGPISHRPGRGRWWRPTPPNRAVSA